MGSEKGRHNAAFHRWASPFCLFASGQLLFVSSSTNGQTTNFHLQDEQTVDGLRKILWASVFHFSFETWCLQKTTCLLLHEGTHMFHHSHIYIDIYVCIHTYIYGKRKFVLLGRQTINGNRWLLFQQTCPYVLLFVLSEMGPPVCRHLRQPHQEPVRLLARSKETKFCLSFSELLIFKGGAAQRPLFTYKIIYLHNISGWTILDKCF
jgi:hypothetical protein